MATPSLTNRHRLTAQSNSSDIRGDEYEDLLDYDGCGSTRNSSRNHSDVSCMNREVYLSLVWQTGHLGMSYYDVATLQIHVMAETPENDDFSLVKQIFREVQPKVIVLSSLHDSGLLSCLKKQISEKSPLSDNTIICKLEFLPNSDFNYEVSKRRILSTQLPSIPQHFSDEERKLYFASLLGLDKTCMIRSVGGLLKYLDKMRIGVELEDASTHVSILGFHAFTLESLIQIDMRTYFALNIFRTELHPSVYKFGACGSKEGLSLFGILNRCKSSIGSRMLRQWFLRPIRDVSLLRQKYDAISFCLKPCNMEAVSCLQGCLKNIKYIPRVLLRMSKAQATIADWISLSKTIYHAVYIGETCRSLAQTVTIFRKIGIAFTDDLHRCYNLLCKTIDFEASKQSKRFVVQANVDEKLDAKKCTFNGLPDLMSRVAREELKALSDDIKACVVSYLPQIGYLLVIDMPEGQSETGDHTIEGLEYKFASDNQLFYKSPRTLELDRLLGDTQLEIIDMEVAIMHHLQDAILEKTQLLLDVMELTAELDCLMSLATCANEFGYVRPSLVAQTLLNITNGRHPLQELCCSPYVSNHITMGGQGTKMKLLTGPNACGKSVYLKQAGLIVFMAHIGSFVPAEEASIGPVDKIFSCIKSLESVSEGLSTFMQDNVQVSEALHQATPNSLLLIDEFGKGTESTDGVALLTAVIKFWIDKGPACPLVLVSTHFHSIIQQNLLPPSTELQFLTFDTVINGDDLVYLYQIKEGHTSSSYACNVALQVGMPPSIVKRGKEVSDLLAQNMPISHLWDSDTNVQTERYERVVNAFLKLNLDTDDLQSFLNDYVLPLCADQQEKNKPLETTDTLQCVPEVNLESRHDKSQVMINMKSRKGEREEYRETNTDIQLAEVLTIQTTVDRNTEIYSKDQGLTKDKTDVFYNDQSLSNNKTNFVSKDQSLAKDKTDVSKDQDLAKHKTNVIKNQGLTKDKTDATKDQCLTEDKTDVFSKNQDLAAGKINVLYNDQCLTKDQKNRNSVVSGPKNWKSVDLMNKQSRDNNTRFLTNPSCTMRENFIRTPLLENTGRKTSKQLLKKCDMNISEPHFTNTAQDQSITMTSECQQYKAPRYCSGTKQPEKRKTDLKFLFASLPKQTKSCTTSSSIVKKQSSSSTISPASETYSDRGQEKGFTTHLSSTESQKTNNTLQSDITLPTMKEVVLNEESEEMCDSGTSADSQYYSRYQDKKDMRKHNLSDLSTSGSQYYSRYQDKKDMRKHNLSDLSTTS